MSTTAREWLQQEAAVDSEEAKGTADTQRFSCAFYSWPDWAGDPARPANRPADFVESTETGRRYSVVVLGKEGCEWIFPVGSHTRSTEVTPATIDIEFDPEFANIGWTGTRELSSPLQQWSSYIDFITGSGSGVEVKRRAIHPSPPFEAFYATEEGHATRHQPSDGTRLAARPELGPIAVYEEAFVNGPIRVRATHSMKVVGRRKARPTD